MSQKFVPLISCAITFDQNFIFTWNFWKFFIALPSKCIQRISDRHVPLCILSHSVTVAAWRDESCSVQRVEPQMIHFEFSLSPGTQEAPFLPDSIIFFIKQLKKLFLALIQKKVIIPASLHCKALVPLYKFERRWTLLGGLSRGFVLPSNLRFSWTSSRLNL